MSKSWRSGSAQNAGFQFLPCDWGALEVERALSVSGQQRILTISERAEILPKAGA
jgi:hypothetical protein